MAVLKTLVQWFPEGGKVEPIEIIDWERITTRQAQELKNNTMTIIVKNIFDGKTSRKFIDSDGRVTFGIDDVFKIYSKYDVDGSGLSTAANSPDLLFVGDLRDIDSKVNDNNATFNLTFNDRTFNLLNGIHADIYGEKGENLGNSESPYVSSGGGWTSPLIIQDMIRKRAETVDDNLPANKIIYDKNGNSWQANSKSAKYLIDARLKSEGGFIQDNRTVSIDKNGNLITRSDFGTPDTDTTLFPTVPIATRNYNFPLISFTIPIKPVYEMLLELSQINYLNTENELNPDSSFSPVIKRSMRFYIDELNRFHWFYPTDDVSSGKDGTSLSISMGNNTNPIEIKNHDLKFAVSDVINFIFWKAGIDMNGNQILGYEYDSTSGSPVFKQSRRDYPKIAQQMKLDDKLIVNKSAEGGFDYPTTYPHTPIWNKGVAVNSDSEYNTRFREVARSKASARAQRVMQGKTEQLWKGKIEFRGYNFTVGDLISYTSQAGGLKNELLRINDVSHNITKSGWFTSVSVEADAPELEV